jgi:ribosomal protein S17E
MLDHDMVVTTSWEYFKKVGRIDFDDDKDFTPEESKEIEAIQRILCIKIAIYLTRRTSGCDGYVVDTLRGMCRELIEKYELDFTRKFEDFNKDIDW